MILASQVSAFSLLAGSLKALCGWPDPTFNVVFWKTAPGRLLRLSRSLEPNNPSEIWSGRGTLPRWLAMLIASGRSRDEFRIR